MDFILFIYLFLKLFSIPLNDWIPISIWIWDRFFLLLFLPIFSVSFVYYHFPVLLPFRRLAISRLWFILCFFSWFLLHPAPLMTTRNVSSVMSFLSSLIKFDHFDSFAVLLFLFYGLFCYFYFPFKIVSCFWGIAIFLSPW